MMQRYSENDQSTFNMKEVENDNLCNVCHSSVLPKNLNSPEHSQLLTPLISVSFNP